MLFLYVFGEPFLDHIAIVYFLNYVLLFGVIVMIAKHYAQVDQDKRMVLLILPKKIFRKVFRRIEMSKCVMEYIRFSCVKTMVCGCRTEFCLFFNDVLNVRHVLQWWFRTVSKSNNILTVLGSKWKKQSNRMQGDLYWAKCHSFREFIYDFTYSFNFFLIFIVLMVYFLLSCGKATVW